MNKEPKKVDWNSVRDHFGMRADHCNAIYNAPGGPEMVEISKDEESLYRWLCSKIPVLCERGAWLEDQLAVEEEEP